VCATENTTLPLSDPDRSGAEEQYPNVALAIAAFEDSKLVNRFSSKFDYFRAGLARLTPREKRGLELFEGKAMCSACHTSEGRYALFTDFSFDNIGVPETRRTRRCSPTASSTRVWARRCGTRDTPPPSGSPRSASRRSRRSATWTSGRTT
jgi:cytochrome c peroxidase